MMMMMMMTSHRRKATPLPDLYFKKILLWFFS